MADKRREFTGEPHQTSLNALLRRTGHEAPIPDPSPTQATLEFEFLRFVGNSGTILNGIWIPGDTAFGIEWVSPARDSLAIKCDPLFLPDFVKALPHCWEPGDDVAGIVGLRWTPRGDGISLWRLGYRGEIILRDVTTTLWKAAINEALRLEQFDIRLIGQRPKILSSEEAEQLRTYTQVSKHYGWGSFTSQPFNILAARVLRRKKLFDLSPGIQDVALWHSGYSDLEQLKIEWTHGPGHPKMLKRLYDRHFGIQAGITNDFTCTCHIPPGSCYTAILTPHDAPAVQLCLRRAAKSTVPALPNKHTREAREERKRWLAHTQHLLPQRKRRIPRPSRSRKPAALRATGGGA